MVTGHKTHTLHRQSSNDHICLISVAWPGRNYFYANSGKLLKKKVPRNVSKLGATIEKKIIRSHREHIIFFKSKPYLNHCPAEPRYTSRTRVKQTRHFMLMSLRFKTVSYACYVHAYVRNERYAYENGSHHFTDYREMQITIIVAILNLSRQVSALETFTGQWSCWYLDWLLRGNFN